MKEGIIDPCNVCGKDATIESDDPYVREFGLDENEEGEILWWCDDCYQDRLDDI